MRLGRGLRAVLLTAMALWALASLAQLPPLHHEGVPERADGILAAIAVPAVVLYCVSAFRYLQLWRQRPSLMLLSMMSAFVLLAEAMIAVVFARNWALSWWEWHLLLLAAFGLVAAGRASNGTKNVLPTSTSTTPSRVSARSVCCSPTSRLHQLLEDHQPAEVTAMLNTYFEAVVPPIVSEFGGDVERIIGDALMVTFNKRGDQPNHARLAASAGLALQNSAARLAQAHPEWPVSGSESTAALSPSGYWERKGPHAHGHR